MNNYETVISIMDKLFKCDYQFAMATTVKISHHFVLLAFILHKDRFYQSLFHIPPYLRHAAIYLFQ